MFPDYDNTNECYNPLYAYKVSADPNTSEALEMAQVHKYQPHTKHLNAKLHHFWDYIACKEITIHIIYTKDHLVDYLTKPVNIDILQKLWKIVTGW